MELKLAILGLVLSVVGLVLNVVGLLFPNEFKSLGDLIKTGTLQLSLTNWLQLLTLTVLVVLVGYLVKQRNE